MGRHTRAKAKGRTWWLLIHQLPLLLSFAVALTACHGTTRYCTSRCGGSADGDGGASDAGCNLCLPLSQVSDVELPGGATRFDYQDIDAQNRHLVVAHMNDNSVLVLSLADGSVAALLPNIPTPRGVIAAPDVGRIFVTSTPAKVVIIDAATLTELSRVGTGTAPDGIGWDPVDKIVGVSDQGDGAISLITNSGDGTRTQVPVGVESGNVVYDSARGQFWITAVQSTPPDQLVAVDPTHGTVRTRIGIPGCDGAHGLRLHSNGQSAIIACENNSKLARVALDGSNAATIVDTGSDPDVLSIDPGLSWIYVAAESGDLTVFDLSRPGLTRIDSEHPGDNSHTVAVDPATHRVFFPLMQGPKGTPVLRIMKPTAR